MRSLSTRTLLASFALLAVGFTVGRVVPSGPSMPNTQEEMLAYLQGYNLTPCFASSAAAHVHVHRLAAHRDGTKPQDRPVVMGGLEAGMPIPENCFAVQTGLYGIATSYWQQPSEAHLRMPDWNPLEGGHVASLDVGAP